MTWTRQGEDDGTLGPALLRAVLGPKRGGVRQLPVPAMVRFLEKRYGTRPPRGLKEHTWRRMRRDPSRGTTPATREAIVRAYAAARLSEAREARLRQPGAPIVFKGGVQISSDARVRRIDVHGWPDDDPAISDLVDAVLDAYHDGDIDGMADAFAEAMEASIGSPIEFYDVEWITIG